MRRSVRYNGARHKMEIGPTKRKKVRTVDFGDTLTRILRKSKKEQHRQRLQYGQLYHLNYYKEVTEKNRVYYELYHLDGTAELPEDYTEISLVCLRPDGTYESPSTLGIVCRTIKDRLPGFENFHFHTLRHPYVKHKTKSFLRNSRVFKADFCAPSHSLCTEVFHFPDNINLISGVNIHTFNQCVSQGGI